MFAMLFVQNDIRTSAFYDAQEDNSIGVVLLSAEGPSSKMEFTLFVVVEIKMHVVICMRRDNIVEYIEVQRLICFMPKVVIAVVPGWAVGGGHSLHVVCDLTLASKEHAILQTDADD
jgi:naphthoate synthase